MHVKSPNQSGIWRFDTLRPGRTYAYRMLERARGSSWIRRLRALFEVAT